MKVPSYIGNAGNPVYPESNPLHRNLVEAELVASVAWLIRLRWIAGVGVVAAAGVIGTFFPVYAPTQVISSIGGGILFYNFIFYLIERWLTLKTEPAPLFKRLAEWQTGLDWLAMTLLIHFSGGIESPAVLFFIFHIIIASIFFTRRMAYTFAFLAIVLVSGIAFLEYSELIPHRAVVGYLKTPLYQNSIYLAALLVFFASTGLISAYMVTSIHDRLKKREEEVVNLTESLQRATVRLQALNEGARTVGSTLELKEVLDRLVKSTAAAMGVRACSIRLLDASGHRLEPIAVYGLSQTYLDKGPVDPGINPLAREVLSGKTINIPDAPDNPMIQYPEEAQQEGIHSMLSAPLIGKSGPMGILRAYAIEPSRFTKDDEAFLTAIAAQGSIAIENALAYQSIEELDAVKSQFVRMVTHELRSPVSVTRSLLKTVAGGFAGSVTEQQQDILDRSIRRIDFLQKLVDDLLDLATSKTFTKDQEERQPISLAASLERVVKRFEVPAIEKGIEIEWQDGTQDGALMVMATTEGLDRIFNNLLSNAIKYTPSGGRVKVKLNRVDDEAQVTVEDTGIGIPEGGMEHLFEEFYRAPNAKEIEREGTGLGLTIIKDTVTRYDGRVSVQSKENIGTKLTIVLPLVKDRKF